MKRRALTVVMAAVIAWTVVASSLPAAQGAAADWSRPKSIESGGIRVYYPRSWHASVDQSMISIRSGATRIMLIDYGTIEAGYFPPRPDHFKLEEDDRRFLSCLGFEGWNVIFTDRGQAVQAFVKLGSGTRKSDAAEVLNRLEVG